MAKAPPAPPPQLRGEQFWVDRYLVSPASTLPIAARGLHREMLSQAWLRQATLPLDYDEIRRSVKCSMTEWKHLWPKVKPFWVRRGQVLVNLDQQETYSKTLEAHLRAVSRSRKAAAARWEGEKRTPPPATAVKSPRKNAQGDAQAHAQAYAQASPKAPMHKHMLKQCDQDQYQSTDRTSTPVPRSDQGNPRSTSRSTAAIASELTQPVENSNPGGPGVSTTTPRGMAAALRDHHVGVPARRHLRVVGGDQAAPGAPPPGNAVADRVDEGDGGRAARAREAITSAGNRAAARFAAATKGAPERRPAVAAAPPAERGLDVDEGDREDAHKFRTLCTVVNRAQRWSG